MNRHSQEFFDVVAKVNRHELTRLQAAANLGVPYSTFMTWVNRAGLSKKALKIEPKPFTATPDNVNDSVCCSVNDPVNDNPTSTKPRRYNLGSPLTQEKADALNAAVDKVLRGEISARAAALERPDLNLSFVTIAAKVRKIRLARGLPVQVRSKKASSPVPDDGANELRAYMQTKYGSQT